jgi:hypothetical protein
MQQTCSDKRNRKCNKSVRFLKFWASLITVLISQIKECPIFLASLRIAVSSHRKPASAGTFRDSYPTQMHHKRDIRYNARF